MKRMISLLLCVMLVLGAVPALAASHYDTLPEKLTRQLEKGSGLKGVMTLTVEGEADWAKLLAPISGVQFSLRGIVSGDQYEYSVFQEDEAGNQSGVTTVWGDPANVYLQSDLLIDTLLCLPLHGDVISSLTGMGTKTPTFYSAAAAIASVEGSTWEASWAPALAPYYDHIQAWMTPYAAEPVVTRVGVVSQVEISYTMPGDAVKEECKALLDMAFQDQALLAMLGAQMTEEQRAAYLDPGYAWYYANQVDALELPGSVVLTYTMSAQGEMLGSKLELPLSGEWQRLIISESGVEQTYTLTGDERYISVTMDVSEDGTTAGVLSWKEAADTEEQSCAFEIAKTVDIYDTEDTRRHEVTDWTITLEPETVNVIPSTIQLRLHYYSKPADNQSTTLEVQLTAALPGGTLGFTGRFRSTGDWAIPERDTTGAKVFSEMSAEARTELITDLMTNALIMFGMSNEEPATATDVATPTQLDELPMPEEMNE